MRKTLHVVSLLSLSLCFPNRLPAQSGTDPFKQQLEPMIEQVMKQQEVPGFAIAIVRDQEIVYVAGFGVRNIDNKNDKITPRSLFHMASITKRWTSHSA